MVKNIGHIGKSSCNKGNLSQLFENKIYFCIWPNTGLFLRLEAGYVFNISIF